MKLESLSSFMSQIPFVWMFSFAAVTSTVHTLITLFPFRLFLDASLYKLSEENKGEGMPLHLFDVCSNEGEEREVTPLHLLNVQYLPLVQVNP